MPAIPSLTVTFDHAQRRIKHDRCSILAEGSYPPASGGNGRATGWDAALSSNVWQETVTYETMLMPGPIDPAWASTDSGIYTKLHKADFTFSAPADWLDQNTATAVGWLYKPKVNNESLITNSTLDANQGMFLGFYVHGGSDEHVVAECGWSDDLTRQVALRFWSSGKVELWKGTDLVASGRWNGAEGAGAAVECWVGILMIPYRLRDLLVVSTLGGGFSHTFADLDEDGTPQTVTPATKFWVKLLQGTAEIQVAKVQYASEGTLVSLPLSFADAPDASQTQSAKVYSTDMGLGAPTATGSVVENDGVTAFVADGSAVLARMSVALSGGPSATSFVSAAEGVYDPTYDVTDDSEEADFPWQGLSLSVPDSPRGVKVTPKILGPDATGIAQLRTQTNRPVLVMAGTSEIMDGRSGEPEVTYGVSSDVDYFSVDVFDEWQGLENYRFVEAVPLDGLDWHAVVTWLVRLPGFNGTVDITDPGVTLGRTATQAAGEYNLLIKPLETAAEWLERLFEAVAGDWFYGFVPTTAGKKFYGRPPDLMPTTPAVELFSTKPDAVAQLILEGMSADDAERYYTMRCVHAFNLRASRPETNDSRISGRDTRANKILQAKYVDDGSIDYSTPPSMRPANWQGERIRAGYSDPILTNQGLVDGGALKLGPRAAKARLVGDMTLEMVFTADGVPLWRGDVLRIDGDQKYRVLTLGAEADKDPTGTDGADLWSWRPAHYTVEQYIDGDPWSVRTGAKRAKDVTVARFRRFASIVRDVPTVHGTGRPRG